MNPTVSSLDSAGLPVLDVRRLPCSEKHPHIIETWWKLPVNGAFVVRNRHAPERIRQQIEASSPGALGWEVVAVKSDDVYVKLSKLCPVGGRLEISSMPCHTN